MSATRVRLLFWGLFCLWSGSETGWASDIPSLYSKEAYEPQLKLLERQVKLACAKGGQVGEGRAYLASRTMERAQRLQQDVRKRIDAIYQFMDDPFRTDREARADQLDRRIAALRERLEEKAAILERINDGIPSGEDAISAEELRQGVQKMATKLAWLRDQRERNRQTQSPFSPASAKLQERAEKDLESLSKVLDRLDGIDVQANGCYAAACNLNADSADAARCGEAARMRALAPGSHGVEIRVLGIGPGGISGLGNGSGSAAGQ